MRAVERLVSCLQSCPASEAIRPKVSPTKELRINGSSIFVDGHRSLGDSSVRVDLLQDAVDVDHPMGRFG